MMKRHAHSTTRQGGFTLVETIVAMAIFAIVLTAVAASLRVVNDATRRTQNLSDTYQTARIVLAEITKNVHNFYPYLAMLPQGTDSTTQPAAASLDATEQEEQAFIGVDDSDRSTGADLDRVSFVAVASDDLMTPPVVIDPSSRSRSSTTTSETNWEDQLPRFDMTAVTFYVEANPNSNLQGLVRVIDRLPGLASEDSQPEVILLSEKVRSLNLRYFDPFMQEWLDEWAEPTYFPTAVMITVGVEREGGSGQLLYLSSVTSLPMGGDAPEDVLAALEETEQGTTSDGQPLSSIGGNPPSTRGGGGSRTGRPPTGGGRQ
jgi:prepilin-type N-terminal cleavage/methylation domain-containing protein